MSQLHQNQASRSVHPDARRPYRKPTLVVHGDVSRITGFMTGGVRNDKGRPIGRLYTTS